MPGQLTEAISCSAARLIEPHEQRGKGAALDYSQASLAVVEEIADEAARWAATLSAEQLTGLVQDVNCYLLEVGRHEFGGEYRWHDEREQPVLVVGEPCFRARSTSCPGARPD